MAKLRKAISVSKEEPKVEEQKPSAELTGALNMLDGYVENLESSNANIENVLSQLASKELSDTEKADLNKMLNLNLKYTNSISKRIKRKS